MFSVVILLFSGKTHLSIFVFKKMSYIEWKMIRCTSNLLRLGQKKESWVLLCLYYPPICLTPHSPDTNESVNACLKNTLRFSSETIINTQRS